MKAHRCVLSAGLRLTQHSVGLAGGEGGEPQDPGSTLPASYYDALSGTDIRALYTHLLALCAMRSICNVRY